MIQAGVFDCIVHKISSEAFRFYFRDSCDMAARLIILTFARFPANKILMFDNDVNDVCTFE